MWVVLAVMSEMQIPFEMKTGHVLHQMLQWNAENV